MALEVSQGVILKKVIAIYFFISVILFYLDHKFCKDDKLILTKNKQTNKQQTSDFSDFSLFSEVDLDCFLKHKRFNLAPVYILTVAQRSISSHSRVSSESRRNVLFYSSMSVLTHHRIRYKYRTFPSGSDGEESTCNAGNLGSTSELGRSPGEGNGYPHQCFCLENSMDGGA